MDKQPFCYYEFGPFRLSVTDRLLHRSDQLVPLTPKLVDTLVLLVENSGHVMTKDALMQALWPDSFVEESSLTQNISLLRKALTENGSDHYIETIPKRGYRFVAPVRVLDLEGASSATEEMIIRERSATQVIVENIESLADERSNGKNGHNPSPVLTRGIVPTSSRSPLTSYAMIALVLLSMGGVLLWLRAAKTGSPSEINSLSSIRSIAILPLRSLSNDSRDEYLGIGMADSLILKLSKFRQMRVLPTSTVLKYNAGNQNAQSAGRDMGVQAVLHGTLQRDGERVRVRLMLISVEDGRSLWSDEFEEKFADIFSLQDAISQRVSETLALNISNEQRMNLVKHYTEDPNAYQSYLMGVYFLNKRTKEGFVKAVEHFQDAVNKDPNYALAYAGLADSIGLMAYYGYVDSREAEYARAKAMALKALQIDDSIAEPYGTLGLLSASYEIDQKRAMEFYRKAIEINPNYAAGHSRYGWLLQIQGNLDEALSEMLTAQQLDPVSVFSNVALAQLYYYRRNYDEAIMYGTKAVELEAGSFMAHHILGLSYEQKRMFEQALAEMQKARESAAGGLEMPDALEALSHIKASSGRKDEARKLLAELQEISAKGRPVRPLNFVVTYEGLGDRRSALAWLQKAFEEGKVPVIQFRFDPRLDGIRSDPGFVHYMAPPKSKAS